MPWAGKAELEHALGGLSIQGTGTETGQLPGRQLQPGALSPQLVALFLHTQAEVKGCVCRDLG